MLKNKILVISSILPKEFTHLYGLIEKTELQNEQLFGKIQDFYNNKKNELENYNKNKDFYSFMKQMSDKYKDQLIIVNQEIDNNYSKYNIPHISLQGNMEKYNCLDCKKISNLNVCEHCNSTKTFFNISLKNDKNQYKEIVDLLDECQFVIFLGNIGQIDPTLFLDEIVDSIYIGTEDIDYQGSNPYLDKELKNNKLSTFFDKSFIVDDYDNCIDNLKDFIELHLSKQNFVNMIDPYKDKGKEIVDLVDVYFEVLKNKHNIENKNYDKKMIRKIKECYPFIKKLPEIYVHNIWFTYCYDTNQNPLHVKYDDLFYDMLLVYSKYRWNGVKKFFTKRPKISLTLAYNSNNEKEIEIFKKLLFKKNYI